MERTYNLSRFTQAHERDYQMALTEIRRGKKISHWMWYIFPQLKGLGHSETSVFYSILDLDEAKAFLADPYLGNNLTQITSVLLRLPEKDPVCIFGKIDAVKLFSSMTLFACASGENSIFEKILDKYFEGQKDRRTLKILGLSGKDTRYNSDVLPSTSLTLSKSSHNIERLRNRFPDGLHFVVGDVHGEGGTLKTLMEKICFDPQKDHVYFIGDYNAGGNPWSLLQYMSLYYQEDYEKCGFHMIRGNHERELFPVYPLENLPDILVVRGKQMNYFLTHAGMVTSAFNLILNDMEENPEQPVLAYRLDMKSTVEGSPLRQITWSKYGLYNPLMSICPWPSSEVLVRNKACIIHGHSPYSYFKTGSRLSYGLPRNIFWEEQHIFFSESLQSFNIDSDIKGRNKNGETYRGIACICLEIIGEIAEKSEKGLTLEGIADAENFVFSAPLEGPLSLSMEHFGFFYQNSILTASPSMKTITVDKGGLPYFTEQ